MEHPINTLQQVLLRVVLLLMLDIKLTYEIKASKLHQNDACPVFIIAILSLINSLLNSIQTFTKDSWLNVPFRDYGYMSHTV